MNEIVLLASSVPFGSFVWGMVRSFRQPAGKTAEAALVSLTGAGCLAWHAATLASCSPSWWQGLSGFLMYAGATTLFWSAVNACGAQPFTAIGQPDEPKRLVQHGPYRHIRHPFYTSYMIAWTAGWVTSGNAWLLVSVACMGVAYVRGVRQEEAKFARSALACAYAAYRRRAGMFLPKLRGIKADPVPADPEII